MILEKSFGEVKRVEEFALKKVFKSSEHLIQKVENLLYLSRIESHKFIFNLEYCDFEELVQRTIDRYGKIIQSGKTKLVYKKPLKKIGDIKIDEEKMRLVVINLLDNAVKSSERGNITVSLKEKSDKVIFCISNIGQTISKGRLNSIFKKFSGNGKDIGIGLYITKCIIDGHQGEIFVKNNANGVKTCLTLKTGDFAL